MINQLVSELVLLQSTNHSMKETLESSFSIGYLGRTLGDMLHLNRASESHFKSSSTEAELIQLEECYCPGITSLVALASNSAKYSKIERFNSESTTGVVQHSEESSKIIQYLAFCPNIASIKIT